MSDNLPLLGVGGGGNSAFNPTNIPNISLWLDATDLSTITLNYASLSGTVTGNPPGSYVLNTTSDQSAILSAGSLIRVGPTDTYVVASVTSSQITTVEPLTSLYIGQSLYAAKVSQWNDKSGNMNNATQSVGANQPAYATNAVNGKNCVQFPPGETTNLIPTSNPILGASAATLFWMSRGDPSYTNSLLWGAPVELFGTDLSDTDHIPYSGNIYYGFGSSSRKGVGATTIAQMTSASVFTCVSSATIWSLNQDETLLYSTASNVFAANPTTPSYTDTNSPAFGGRNGTIYFWLGYLGEVIMYNRQLNSTEISQVQTYLKAKWGTA